MHNRRTTVEGDPLGHGHYMSYPDLSLAPFQYRDKATVMVGWLAPEQPFPTGPIPPMACALLRLYVHELEHGTFGKHRCHICDVYEDTGQIHLDGPHRISVAPRMIYHSVAAHQDRPPDEYIQTILATPVEAGAPRAEAPPACPQSMTLLNRPRDCGTL